jgi:small conductance mechanosensitive channel
VFGPTEPTHVISQTVDDLLVDASACSRHTAHMADQQSSASTPQPGAPSTRRRASAAQTRTRRVSGRSRAIGPRTQQRRPFDAQAYRRGAQSRLRRFRQGSALAVAATAFLLLLWGLPAEGVDRVTADSAAMARQPGTGSAMVDDAAATVNDATETVRQLWDEFVSYLPRLALALTLLALAGLLARLTRAVLTRTFERWERATAITALARVVIFVVAGAAALSVLAGDARAAVGSVGLLGLAASWALQTPIESFTGWLLNAFQGYYRVGDRIEVGEVVGDVYRIDVLTTTIWEAGGPGKAVAAAQSTGALITFPNWEVLRSNVVNYTRDFPYVWDEVTVSVANESDLAYCVTTLAGMARRVLGAGMEEAAQQYERLLQSARLRFDVEELPQVYLSTTDAWTNCTIRYLVPVRSRRRWSTALVLEASLELAKPEHRGRIVGAYPRMDVAVRRDGFEDVTPTSDPPSAV